MKLGDKVTWTSQAAGIRRAKEGTIVEVVPPNCYPLMKKNNGAPRKHESYVVRATAVRGQNRSFRLYWPLVRYLELCKEE